MAENSEKKIVGWLSFQDFYGRKAYDITAEISIYLDEKFRGRGYGKRDSGTRFGNRSKT